MQIQLSINNEVKTFTVPFIKGRMFRRVLEINQKTDWKNLTPETLDNLVDFVVETFDKQFSIDEFYDGIDSEKLVETILDVMNTVSGSKGGANKPSGGDNSGK